MKNNWKQYNICLEQYLRLIILCLMRGVLAATKIERKWNRNYARSRGKIVQGSNNNDYDSWYKCVYLLRNSSNIIDHIKLEMKIIQLTHWIRTKNPPNYTRKAKNSKLNRNKEYNDNNRLCIIYCTFARYSMFEAKTKYPIIRIIQTNFIFVCIASILLLTSNEFRYLHFSFNLHRCLLLLLRFSLIFYRAVPISLFISLSPL